MNAAAPIIASADYKSWFAIYWIKGVCL